MSKNAMVIETRGRATNRKEQRELLRDAKKNGLQHEFLREAPEEPSRFPSTKSRGPGVGTVGGGSLRRPAMRASSTRFQAALPFLADVGSGYEGPRVGIDRTGGGYFHFDPWVFYNKGWITGTSIVQVGGIGAGKSTTAKTVLRRSVGEGRKVALASDPKGEHTRVAETVKGSQILRLGRAGQRINVLDEGVKPGWMTAEQWVMEVHTRRQQLLRSLISVMRGGQKLEPEAHTALDHALSRLEATPAVPTIRGLVDRLAHPDAGEEAEVQSHSRHLAHALGRAVSGDLAGMFDEESSVSFDIDAPMLVMDTRVLLNKDQDTKAIASACTSFWIDSVVRDESSGYWYVVNEEGWSEMRDPRTVELMDERQRLAGELGLANWLILHEIQDLDQVGPEGSAQRAQAMGLLSKAQIKIIHRQSEESIDATARAMKLTNREAEKAVNLEQGEALWKIGPRHLVVKTLITSKEHHVFNTSGMRGGK